MGTWEKARKQPLSQTEGGERTGKGSGKGSWEGQVAEGDDMNVSGVSYV